MVESKREVRSDEARTCSWFFGASKANRFNDDEKPQFGGHGPWMEGSRARSARESELRAVNSVFYWRCVPRDYSQLTNLLTFCTAVCIELDLPYTVLSNCRARTHHASIAPSDASNSRVAHTSTVASSPTARPPPIQPIRDTATPQTQTWPACMAPAINSPHESPMPSEALACCM